VKKDSTSVSVQADVIEENGNWTEDVISTYCKGRFSDDVKDMGAMRYVRGLVP